MGIEDRPATPQDARQAVDEGLVGIETTIVSLIEGPEEERIRRRILDFIPTHIPGFYLTVAAGDDAPDLLRSEEESLAQEVRIYFLRDQFIKRLQTLQKPLRKRMIKRAIANEGLRGGMDTATGGEVQLNPNFEIDLQLAEEALGEKIGDYTHPKAIISFELDPEKDDVDGIEKAVKGILKRRGNNPEMVERDDTIQLDRDKFLAAAKRGDISLIPGTITIPDDPGRWKAVPKQVLTVAEVVSAVNRAAENLGLNNPEGLDEDPEE